MRTVTRKEKFMGLRISTAETEAIKAVAAEEVLKFSETVRMLLRESLRSRKHWPPKDNRKRAVDKRGTK